MRPFVTGQRAMRHVMMAQNPIQHVVTGQLGIRSVLEDRPLYLTCLDRSIWHLTYLECPRSYLNHHDGLICYLNYLHSRSHATCRDRSIWYPVDLEKSPPPSDLC